MLAAWLAMTTASTLKDIGEAGARFGFKDDTGIARTERIRQIVCTPTRSPRREGIRAPARPGQLRGRGRLSALEVGLSLSGRERCRLYGLYSPEVHFLYQPFIDR